MAAPRRRPRITLDQLHTFLTVADGEHITAAATRMGMSQGSVSAQVRRLERLLGVPLLHRVGRNVRLTDVGRGVRQLAIQALDVAEQVEQLATGYLAFESGEISVAAGPVVGAHRLSRWLAPFVAAHPDIAVRIRLAPMQALLSMISSGDADIVFMSSDPHVERLETIVLERTVLVAVVASQHPLAASRSHAEALSRYRHLTHERGTSTGMRAARVLGEHADDAQTVELEEGALMAALFAGLGFAVMPRAVVADEIAAGRLVVLSLPGRPVRQAFVAGARTGLRTPAVQSLWQHLKQLADAAANHAEPFSA